MNEIRFEWILRAAEDFLGGHPDQVEVVCAAAAEAIRDLTDITNRHYDADCETFADWLWILETETGDIANEFGRELLGRSQAAVRLGDHATAHGFAVVGAWLDSFRSTFDTIGMERTALSARCHELLCRVFAGHEQMMTRGDGSLREQQIV